MKELWELLKQAGFSAATLAQSLLAAIAFTVIAVLATGFAPASALPMLVGAFLLALMVIAGFKAIHAWRDRIIEDARDKPE